MIPGDQYLHTLKSSYDTPVNKVAWSHNKNFLRNGQKPIKNNPGFGYFWKLAACHELVGVMTDYQMCYMYLNIKRNTF